MLLLMSPPWLTILLKHSMATGYLTQSMSYNADDFGVDIIYKVCILYLNIESEPLWH